LNVRACCHATRGEEPGLMVKVPYYNTDQKVFIHAIFKLLHEDIEYFEISEGSELRVVVTAEGNEALKCRVLEVVLPYESCARCNKPFNYGEASFELKMDTCGSSQGEPVFYTKKHMRCHEGCFPTSPTEFQQIYLESELRRNALKLRTALLVNDKQSLRRCYEYRQQLLDQLPLTK